MDDKAEEARSGTAGPAGSVVVGDRTLRIDPENGAVLAPIGAGERPVPRQRPAPAGDLPRSLPALLGRDGELEAMVEAVHTGASVEVVGDAGIGKTTILCHLAKRVQGSPDLGGVVFLWTAGQPGEDVLQALFEGLFECDTPMVPTVSELRRYLGDRRALVVMDDSALARRELERVMSVAPQCRFAIAGGERRLWGGGRSIVLHGLEQATSLALAQAQLGRKLTARE